VLAIQRGREPDKNPHSERCADGLGEQRMLTEPHTDTADAGKRGESASARINPAPRGRPLASAAKHIVQMHHEVVLQKLGVALLLKTALVELLAIGKTTLRRERNLLRWFALERDGSRRRIKDTCRLPSKARLASPRSPRPARSVGRLDLGEHRCDSYRRFIYGLGRGGLLVHRPGAGCRDVQRHHSVARKVAARGRLLRDDQPDQLRLAAKRAIKTGAQPGAAHSLGGIPRGLADILAHHLAARGAASAGAFRALSPARLDCGSVVHRGY